MALLRGQAHFDVVRERRSFEGLADGRRVVALRTALDVRIDDGRGVLVTLVEGRVAIDVGDRPPALSAPAPR